MDKMQFPENGKFFEGTRALIFCPSTQLAPLGVEFPSTPQGSRLPVHIWRRPDITPHMKFVDVLSVQLASPLAPPGLDETRRAVTVKSMRQKIALYAQVDLTCTGVINSAVQP